MSIFVSKIIVSVRPNSQIIDEFRESFFSLYNHFLVLTAELMEKFLICNNCSTPIGFPHKPLCLTKYLTLPIVWKKTKYDDKFITFGMHFSFNDIFAPGCRKSILSQITSTCFKQSISQRNDKPALSMIPKCWPGAWVRDSKEKAKKPNPMRKTFSAHNQAFAFLPIGNRSIWTPTRSDEQLIKFKHFTQDGFNSSN